MNYDTFTKKEFDETDEPLVLICSLQPEKGKVLYSAYKYSESRGLKEEFEKDFPDLIHFQLSNNAAIKQRKKEFGLTEAD